MFRYGIIEIERRVSFYKMGKTTKKNWVNSVVQNYLCSLIFDNNPDADMKKEYEKIEKVCLEVINDGNLEREIVNLIEESAEWYYNHLEEEK